MRRRYNCGGYSGQTQSGKNITITPSSKGAMLKMSDKFYLTGSKQLNMLADKKLRAFVPTVQPARAKSFYGEILGLKLLSEDDYALEFDANGTLLRVTIVPALTPHPFTVLGWDVEDIASTIKLLNEKGVFFERYAFLEQDTLGIWTAPGGTKVAWFKDPDGNLLSLTA